MLVKSAGKRRSLLSRSFRFATPKLRAGAEPVPWVQLSPGRGQSSLPEVALKWPWYPAYTSPSLEIFKTCLDTVLCSLLWVTLLRQGVGLDDPQRCLPALNIL